MSGKRNKFWTRERIIEALVRFGAEYGALPMKEYEKIAKAAGEGRRAVDRPFPAGWTIRSEFPSLADAYRAAGLEPSDGVGEARRPKIERPRSTAFVTAAEVPEEIRSFDAVVLGQAVVKLTTTPCQCAALRSERDELAWVLREVLAGNESTIRLVRAGLSIAAANRPA